MIRLSVFGLLIAIIVCICSVSPAAAAATAPKAPAADEQVLAPDPFIAQATVTTSVVEVLKCPCTIINGCGYVGEDCADILGCCHCSSTTTGWKCVGTPQ